MDEQKKYERLIDQLWRGEQLTQEEREFVDRYYDAFDERPNVLDTMSENEVSDVKQNLKDRIESHLDTNQKKSRPIKLKRYIRALKVAASLLIFSFMAIYGYRYFVMNGNDSSSILANHDAYFEVGQVYESQGEVRQIQLPDGTLVFLNEYSSLEIDLDFGKGNRRVHLNGEAYFDVAKREQIPFIVYNKDAQVEVLGTSFWINERDRNNYVTLLTGKIQFSEASEKVMMNPNETLGKPLPEEEYHIGKADLSALNAWKPQSFSFQNVNVEHFFEFLQSRFSIEIKIANLNINDCKITTTVDGTETWQELLLLVGMANGFTHQEVDGYILIDGRGCIN